MLISYLLICVCLCVSCGVTCGCLWWMDGGTDGSTDRRTHTHTVRQTVISGKSMIWIILRTVLSGNGGCKWVSCYKFIRSNITRHFIFIPLHRSIPYSVLRQRTQWRRRRTMGRISRAPDGWRLWSTGRTRNNCWWYPGNRINVLEIANILPKQCYHLACFNDDWKKL